MARCAPNRSCPGHQKGTLNGHFRERPELHIMSEIGREADAVRHNASNAITLRDKRSRRQGQPPRAATFDADPPRSTGTSIVAAR